MVGVLPSLPSARLDWELDIRREIRGFKAGWGLRALIVHLVPSLLSVFGTMIAFRVIVFMFYSRFTGLKKN
jgi:hypothetical protein